MSSFGLTIRMRSYTREPASTITIYWYFPLIIPSKINNLGISINLTAAQIHHSI